MNTFFFFFFPTYSKVHMHLGVFYGREQFIRLHQQPVYFLVLSQSKAKQSKGKCIIILEVGHAKIVTHLQVGVTDFCLELLVTITDI